MSNFPEKFFEGCVLRTAAPGLPQAEAAPPFFTSYGEPPAPANCFAKFYPGRPSLPLRPRREREQGRRVFMMDELQIGPAFPSPSMGGGSGEGKVIFTEEEYVTVMLPYCQAPFRTGQALDAPPGLLFEPGRQVLQ